METYYRIALNYIEGFGNAAIKQMLRITGSAEKIFTEPEIWQARATSKKVKRQKPTLTDKARRAVESELKIMQKNGIGICHWLDSGFPQRLKRCNDGPIMMYYIGNEEFNDARTLAVVGTRNATQYGKRSVAKFIEEICGSDITTVSGLAYGIDTFAHEESLKQNVKTVAVLGCGLGRIYPTTNKRLAEQIVENGGTLISEYPALTGPDRINFPRRNRIIAGMADAVLVVESGKKGGSIITAHIANSYNRDVFAIPGSIFEENHDGCHDLIRKNIAAIATSGQDILEMMNWDSKNQPSRQTKLFQDFTENEELIYDFLSGESKSIDQIAIKFQQFTPSKLAEILLTMELKGMISTLPGKKYEILK